MNRQIRDNERHEQKMKSEIKKYAKKNELSSIKVIAKDIVNTRKARERLFVAKAQINSVSMQLQQQAAMVSVSGCIAKSTNIMQSMSQLLSVPSIQETTRTLAMEMEKAGMIDEIVQETMEMFDDDIEDEVSDEVNNVMIELVGSTLKDLEPVPSNQVQKPEHQANEVAEDEEEVSGLEARLAALAS